MSDRKSFVFSREASDRLERLRIVCRQGSGSDVVRLALMVLEDNVRAANQGTIVFKDRNGNSQPYHPLLEPEPIEAMNASEALANATG